MKVRKDIAVAICKDYGFRMADGWSDLKLARKVGDLVELFRSGEFEPEDEALAEELSRLAEAHDGGEIEVVVSDEPEPDREDVSRNKKEAAKESVASDCQFKVNDRVLVDDGTEDRPWSGVVTKILSGGYVEVQSKSGELWDVRTDQCRIEAESSGDDGGAPMQEDVDREQDGVELEIARLRKRIQELRQMKKAKRTAGKKKLLRRDEIAALVLRRHPEGGSVPRLAEEVESEYVEQGRNPSLKKSIVAVKRVAQIGMLLGLFEMRDREMIVPAGRS